MNQRSCDVNGPKEDRVTNNEKSHETIKKEGEEGMIHDSLTVSLELKQKKRDISEITSRASQYREYCQSYR